ncbi:MAG: hypothetical protein JWN86_1713 [Planctomycetota bacterium]|nr:hypothetical protein [Planctomycetota bacterium]
MTTLDVINGMDLASPCKASWNAMIGDDRTRLCAHCDKHVYNIAAMTSTEILELIRETEGSFCGRLYRRRDGTMLTADCPVGAKAFSSGRMHRVLTYGVLGLGFLTTGAFLKAASDRSLTWPPVGPSVTFTDWREWAMRTLGFAAPSATNPSLQVNLAVPGGIRICVPPASPTSGELKEFEGPSEPHPAVKND